MEYKETEKNEIVEEWRDIKRYEGLYQISNLGRVKSFARIYELGHGAVLRHDDMYMSLINLKGYKTVTLCKNGKKWKIAVHRLVAIAFIPNYLNKREINHKNGIKHDNQVKNLEWSTPSENIKHAYKNKLMPNKSKENNFNYNKGTRAILIDTLTNEKTKFTNLARVAEYLGSKKSTVNLAYLHGHLHKRRYKIERDVSNL